MAEEREINRSLVSLSSASEEDYDYEDDDDDDDEYQDDLEENGDDRDSDEEEEDQEFEESDDHNNGGPDQSISDKIFCLLKEHRDLGSLKLSDCKAYLRKYGLRVTGTKSVCLQRIKDHWRLRYGNGEDLYSRSSFSINCTGDVCKGDVVLFWQKVYKKFDKMTRHGRVLGTRVVAGRVVKESYGAAKQQHTFTVEVLWSRGINRLPPLFPLLVKGRNLYRMKTFRQRWHDEAERLKVLAEKHNRGGAARNERAMKTKKWPTSDRGTKRADEFASTRRSKMRKTNEPKKGRDCFDKPEKSTLREFRVSKNHRHQSSTFRASDHFKENQKFTRSSTCKVPSVQPCTNPSPIHHQSQMRSQYMNIHDPFPRRERNADLAMTRFPPSSTTYADTPAQLFPHFGHNNYSNHASVNPGYDYETRTWTGFPELEFRRPFHPLNSGTNTYWPRR